MEKLDYLKKLISIKSFDLNENETVVTELRNMFSGISDDILLIKNTVNDRASLLIGLNCALRDIKDAVVLSGHIDTVFPATHYPDGFEPNVPTLAGDKLYGLGAIDMKSFWAVVLNNATALKDMPVPIVLAITCDEETSIQGAKLLTSKMKELNISPKCVIIGEPTGSQICASSKGFYEYKIDIKGKSCHSSTPENGINANYILANIILLVEKLCSKYPNTTCCSNVISGGNASNIVCDFATMSLEIRTNDKKYEIELMNEISAKISELLTTYSGCDITLSPLYTVPPTEKRNAELIDQICDRFQKNEILFTGACEGGYYQDICDNVFLYGVGDLRLCHQPDEHADIPEFLTYNDTFVDFVQGVCETIHDR